MNILTTYVRNVMTMFFSVCGSMAMGLRTLARPSVTTAYPRKSEWDIPDGSRMKLYNNIDDCIGCYKCSRICPTDCIEIETIKAPDSVDLGTASTGNPLNFWVPKFDIDMVKCCYCDLCTTVCPTECLVMTKAFEGSSYDRGNLVYHFGNVDSREMQDIQKLLEEDQDGGAKTATTESDTEEAAEAEEASSVMGKLIPESIEGLPLKERIRARLITRGKLEGELPDGAEVDESAAPAGTGGGGTATATEPSGGTATETDEPATDEAPGDETTTDTEEEKPEEAAEEPASEDASDAGDASGGGGAGDYVRDPDQPLKDRIRNRLEARGKL